MAILFNWGVCHSVLVVAMSGQVRVHKYSRRQAVQRRPKAKPRPMRVSQPHLKRVYDWEIDGDEATLTGRDGTVIDTLYLDGLVDEWLREAKEKKWVDYNPDKMSVEYDGDEAVILDQRGTEIDRLNLDSIIEEWLREQGGWRPPR